MVFQKYPGYRDDAVWNIVLSYCIQGAYHTFQRNREGDMETLIDVLGDITEVVKGVYEKRH